MPPKSSSKSSIPKDHKKSSSKIDANPPPDVNKQRKMAQTVPASRSSSKQDLLASKKPDSSVGANKPKKEKEDPLLGAKTPKGVNNPKKEKDDPLLGAKTPKGGESKDVEGQAPELDIPKADSLAFMERVKAIKVVYWVAYSVLTVIIAAVTFYIESNDKQREWHLLSVYGYVCIMLAIGDGTPRTFFRPIDETNTEGRKCYAFWLITMTSFVSWVMAKSIQNSAKLGAKYGLVGGLAYAAWFIGVFTTGVIIYFLRKQGYYSLPDFINDRYGPLATLVFALTVLYRLFNEVWSNTIVIADFFGDSLSADWKMAAWVSMGVPAAYTLIGGMRASLYSDALQALLMCALLALTYWRITSMIADHPELEKYAEANHESSSVWSYNPVEGRDMWSLEGGMDLFWTGILQGALSYTFMDPALTDRAFLASKEVMIGGFALGAVLAMAYITVFGFIGVYGNMAAACVTAGDCDASLLKGATLASVAAGEPSAVGEALGSGYYTMLCLVIITSALSTLDSTFSAVAKVVGPDLHGFFTRGRPVNPSEATNLDVLLGRLAIVAVGVTGTLPLLYDPDELSATTVTGTMVPGLGPPIYCAAFACLVSKAWFGRRLPSGKTRPLLFLLPFCFSAALGTVYQMRSQDVNCTPFVLTTCSAPAWTTSSSTACDDYQAFYDCVESSGCWDTNDKKDCQTAESALGCDLDCYAGTANNKPYQTVVDLNGFNIGKGAYKNLLGVNAVSAAGALFLFLFAASDDVFEKRLKAALAKDSEYGAAAGNDIGPDESVL